MNSLPTQMILGASAVLAALVTAAFGGLPLAAGLVSAISVATLVYVAFATQSQRLRDQQRLVYRPVYVRRQIDRRRVGLDD